MPEQDRDQQESSQNQPNPTNRDQGKSLDAAKSAPRHKKKGDWHIVARYDRMALLGLATSSLFFSIPIPSL